MVVMWSEIALVLVYVRTYILYAYIHAVYMYVHNKHINIQYYCKYLCSILLMHKPLTMHTEPLTYTLAWYSPIHPCTPPPLSAEAAVVSSMKANVRNRSVKCPRSTSVRAHEHMRTCVHTYLSIWCNIYVCTYACAYYVLATYVHVLHTHMHSAPAT